MRRGGRAVRVALSAPFMKEPCKQLSGAAPLLSLAAVITTALAQGPPNGGPGSGPGSGPGGGPMGPMGREVQIVERFDKNGDHKLDAEERRPARAWLKENRAQRGGPGGFGP